jgi:hypothetical protein
MFSVKVQNSEQCTTTGLIKTLYDFILDWKEIIEQAKTHKEL